MEPKRLLATDLDGTFIGDDAAMHRLWEELERRGIVVAFSTGRHLPSIEDFYRATGATRRADACLCMVGTEVFLRNEGHYELDEGWRTHIEEGWDKGVVEDILQSIPEARIQDDEWQSPVKSSYYLEENAEARLAELRSRLDREGIRAKVVYSAGRFLDVLPVRSGKGEAVRHLAAELGVRAADVITCGDTGNDLDMMRPELGFRCIAVGNATPELAAHRGPHIYHARRPYAAGIREGLEVFGWLPPTGSEATGAGA